uniref:Uncharacterized protein n=1 Tax=Rhizophagus irregularis (strain DAOM 181602 / DAOM 197198 / MUCL 43194) TaxID=747089 RepID=U9UH23_RHIID
MGWDNKNIIDVLSSNIDFCPFSCKLGDYEIFIYGLGSSTRSDWNQAGNGYKSSIIHTYKKRAAIFVSEIKDDKCYIYIYQDFKIQKTFVGTTPDDVWKNSGYIQKFSGKELFGLEDQITLQKLNKLRIPQCAPHEWNNFKLMKKLYEYHLQRQTFAKIEWYKLFVRWDQNECNVIELNSELKLLYPPEHQFSDRELGAWLSMLRAAGCSDITPWSHGKSEYQLWTKSRNPIQEKQIFTTLYKMGFLSSNPSNSTETFWSCFRQALDDNKKTRDGKRRILSIIANDFTYEELEYNLGVASYTVLESRRHAVLNGFGAPPIEKPKFHRLKFKIEQIDQFDSFFMRKDIVNMSSYRTHSKSGLPIMYLQDHKQALWEKFSEEYPNGMRRTAFMTRLQGSRFVYQDNLGGLCSECNECGYESFASINTIIATHVEDESLKEELTRKLNILRRYMRREYIKDLKITSSGIPAHKSCICHCLSHSFGICNLQHFEICNDCVELFQFFDLIKNQVDEELHELLDDYLKKLISWLGHHARKFYLNTHVQVNLDELDEDGAVIIVDYKMRILPHTARETKSQFFGKRGWTLHSSLVYTKDITNNKLDIQVYDHWSDDTGQDAWFTASSLHTVFENLDPKPKWITIMSDNGPHYHCTELMLIIGQWKEWYDIVPRKWIFLEAGEAKTLIDSHHAQISQAIKRHVKLGCTIESGDDIEAAIHDIAGTKVANLLPNRNQGKEKIGTIAGIKSLHEWTWPAQGEDTGFVCARILPGIGEWKKWSPAQIKKIRKQRKNEKPNPEYSTHTEPSKKWTLPIVVSKDDSVTNDELLELDLLNSSLNSMDITNVIGSSKKQIHDVFVSGWALKSNKNYKRESWKRISKSAKHLLENMFHTGTANPNNKFSAQQMYEELVRRVQLGELDENDVPKISTIQNWITGFSRKWKEIMAIRELEARENE